MIEDADAKEVTSIYKGKCLDELEDRRLARRLEEGLLDSFREFNNRQMERDKVEEFRAHFDESIRAKNIIRKLGVTSFEELAKYTEDELLSYKNFGSDSLEYIKEVMAERGLSLRSE